MLALDIVLSVGAVNGKYLRIIYPNIIQGLFELTKLELGDIDSISGLQLHIDIEPLSSPFESRSHFHLTVN